MAAAAKKRKKRRPGVRRRARRIKRVARRRAPARRRRRASVPAVARRRRAPARRRRRRSPAMAGGKKSVPKLLTALGVGVGGAVATAYAVNAAPIASNRTKALAAMGVGIVAYMMLPKRSRMLRTAAVGASLGGALSLTKQLFPNVPMMAGAEPLRMGVNMRPTYPQIPSQARRSAIVNRSESAAFKRLANSDRNAAFMGRGMSGGLNAVYGNFVTPASM